MKVDIDKVLVFIKVAGAIIPVGISTIQAIGTALKMKDEEIGQ